MVVVAATAVALSAGAPAPGDDLPTVPVIGAPPRDDAGPLPHGAVPPPVAVAPVGTPGSPLETDAAPGSAAQIAIQFAVAQVGLPYVWGGDGPAAGDAGFDCSGLTHAAYGAAGVSLPRTAHTQHRHGPLVRPGSPLMPGDLVFYGVPSRVHHVGLYLGGGRMVNAPRFGEPVQIAPHRWDGDSYLGASRPSAGGATGDGPGTAWHVPDLGLPGGTLPTDGVPPELAQEPPPGLVMPPSVQGLEPPPLTGPDVPPLVPADPPAPLPPVPPLPGADPTNVPVLPATTTAAATTPATTSATTPATTPATSTPPPLTTTPPPPITTTPPPPATTTPRPPITTTPPPPETTTPPPPAPTSPPPPSTPEEPGTPTEVSLPGIGAVSVSGSRSGRGGTQLVVGTLDPMPAAGDTVTVTYSTGETTRMTVVSVDAEAGTITVS